MIMYNLVLTKEKAQKGPQKFENLAMIRWLDAGNNLKISII